jgi:chaperonin GroEL
VRGSSKGTFGFNVALSQYEHLMAAGVIDPTRVVRSALENAASIATRRLTTEALAELPEKKKAAMPDLGRHGRDMPY